MLEVGLVPRRIVPKLCHFQWLLKMNLLSNWRNLGPILRGTDPTVSATAPRVFAPVSCRRGSWLSQ